MKKRRAGSNQQRRINTLIQHHINLQSVEKGEPSQDLSDQIANYVSAISNGAKELQADYEELFEKLGISLTTAKQMIAKQLGGET